MSLTEYISHHPIIALTVGTIHIISAHVITHFELPVIVMQIFQLGAWSTTIAVGLITIYGFYKKRKDERKRK